MESDMLVDLELPFRDGTPPNTPDGVCRAMETILRRTAILLEEQNIGMRALCASDDKECTDRDILDCCLSDRDQKIAYIQQCGLTPKPGYQDGWSSSHSPGDTMIPAGPQLDESGSVKFCSPIDAVDSKSHVSWTHSRQDGLFKNSKECKTSNSNGCSQSQNFRDCVLQSPKSSSPALRSNGPCEVLCHLNESEDSRSEIQLRYGCQYAKEKPSPSRPLPNQHNRLYRGRMAFISWALEVFRQRALDLTRNCETVASPFYIDPRLAINLFPERQTSRTESRCEAQLPSQSEASRKDYLLGENQGDGSNDIFPSVDKGRQDYILNAVKRQDFILEYAQHNGNVLNGYQHVSHVHPQTNITKLTNELALWLALCREKNEIYAKLQDDTTSSFPSSSAAPRISDSQSPSQHHLPTIWQNLIQTFSIPAPVPVQVIGTAQLPDCHANDLDESQSLERARRKVKEFVEAEIGRSGKSIP